MKSYTADELKEVLAQHKLWLESGYVQGARAILTRANLSDADLSSADLRHADLRGAVSLNGAIGNMSQVKSIQANGWPVTYTATHMQIGCQLHTLEAWWAFTDSEIAAMDESALEWWKVWRPMLAAIIEASPALPGVLA